MTYRELQAALKAFRTKGLDVQVKLNASFDTLQAEYNRLTAIAAEPVVEMTADEFNEWVGLPTDVVEVPGWQKAIADQDDVGLEAICMTNDRMRVTASSKTAKALYSKNSSLFALNASANLIVNLAIAKDDQGNEPTTKQPPEQLEVPPDGDITLQLGGNIKEPTLETTFGEVQAVSEQIEVEFETKHRVEVANQGNLPHNEPYSDQENSQSTVEQGFKSIPVEPREQYLQTAFESPESLPGNTLAITLNDSPNSPYWIDGTELGQNLEYTQAQALRNLEDGLNWLLRLPGRLKAFEQGFREGLRNAPIRRQVSLKQPHVIPIERSHRLPTDRVIPLAA